MVFLWMLIHWSLKINSIQGRYYSGDSVWLSLKSASVIIGIPVNFHMSIERDYEYHP
jgi:hypothetical protein